MNCKEYNIWRRDIRCEYTLRTGRAYPKETRIPWREDFRLKLVQMSDQDVVPNPVEAVDILIAEGYLKGE